MNELIDIKSQQFCFLGEGSHFEGNLKISSPTQIAGQFKGKINAEHCQLISIELSGKIEGELNCRNLEIFGSMEGKIEANGIVIFHPTAKFSGEIKALDFKILPGAQVNMEGVTKGTSYN